MCINLIFLLLKYENNVLGKTLDILEKTVDIFCQASPQPLPPPPKLVTLLKRVVVLQPESSCWILVPCLIEASNSFEGRSLNSQVIKYPCDGGLGNNILSPRGRELVFSFSHEYPEGNKQCIN